MTSRTTLGLAMLTITLITAGCGDDEDPFGLNGLPIEPEVFADQFADGVSFSAFEGSKADAISVDTSQPRSGTASLKVAVPAPGDPAGSYAGGAVVATAPRDFSRYDALTFWAKASTDVTLNTVGFGNDNTGTTRFMAEASDIPLSSTWTKFVIPIPFATLLVEEDGLFYFAEGAEGTTGYDIWFDDVRFERVGTLADPRPEMETLTVAAEVGSTAQVSGTAVTFSVEGTDVPVAAGPGYFTFFTSNKSVATVDEDGVVSIVGEGTATITGLLSLTPVSGEVTVRTAVAPTTPAPSPTQDPADVISLFSNAYTDVTVDTWSAVWDQADVTDADIDGDDMKVYSNLVFAGIEFTSQTVDATSMERFRMDIWTPDDPGSFNIKLVDFGADGAFDGGDDVEHELTLSASSTPAVETASWVSIDVPLSDFAGLTTTGHLAQLIISGELNTVYVDNVYLYTGGGPPPTMPTVAAPTPTEDPADVISLFSNAYTDVTVDTWSAVWDDADVADVLIAGDDVKEYTNLVFAGIEFTSSTVNATAMNRYRMDVWTPDAGSFKVKLVDFGADGSFDGGDDVEHELTFNASTTPALVTGSWVTIDVPLSEFTGLTTTGHLAQLIISGDPNTVYVDNVYLYSGSAPPPPTVPTVAAPTPTQDPANVVSLFSNAYTDVAVDTWSAVWDDADVADVLIAGDDVKEYTNLVFAGIEATTTPIDASAMTHFRFDMWTPDPTADPAAFKVKVVDFGADGSFDGGDDVEHEITLTDASTPPLATGSWLSYDIPLADFTGLTTTGAIAQLIISGDPNTVYIDNVYMYDASAPPPPAVPTVAAPTPTQDPANVVSLFSNAYTDVAVDTWSAVWDAADVADVLIAGDDVKEYTNLVFAGIEATTTPIDASAMTHFRFDMWTPDPTADPAAFKVKLVDFGADGSFDGGDDVEHEITLTDASTPPLATGSWLSYDIPLADFTGLTTTGALAQLIISGDPNTVYIDNVFFYIAQPTAPTAAAPTPTQDPANVVSLFSNAYTDVAVDTWSAVWDAADVADVLIAGDDVKEYTNLVFAGIEATTTPIDASAMTHFRFDMWTPDPTADPAAFKVKLVDFGADGSFDGGDDVEHEITLTDASTPPLATGSWLSYDIPLADFTGLTTTGAIAQLIISGDPNTVYIDNVYLRN